MKSFRRFLLEDTPNKKEGESFKALLDLQSDPNFNAVLAKPEREVTLDKISKKLPNFLKGLPYIFRLKSNPDVRSIDVTLPVGPQGEPKNIKADITPDLDGSMGRTKLKDTSGNIAVAPDAIAAYVSKSKSRPTTVRQELTNTIGHEGEHVGQSVREEKNPSYASRSGPAAETSRLSAEMEKQQKSVSSFPEYVELMKRFHQKYTRLPTEISGRRAGARGTAAAHVHETGKIPSFEDYLKAFNPVAQRSWARKRQIQTAKRSYGRVADAFQEMTGTKVNPQTPSSETPKPTPPPIPERKPVPKPPPIPSTRRPPVPVQTPNRGPLPQPAPGFFGRLFRGRGRR
jgi:hypothetical protein